ncbi:hypothetical protein BGZ91_002828 [Linnemannia elongata]|nr:hypothetical protein BGZ91_002828 [Linnemannia elongata]
MATGRFIVLFRGTAQTPAIYMDPISRRLRFEPSGWKPDFDMIGVAFSSFEEILPSLKQWYKDWATEDGITFIGHSLGGALALRAMSQRALELYQQSREQSKDVAFIYSSAGVDPFTSARLSRQFDKQAIRGF